MRFVLKIIVLVFFWEKHMKSYQVVENGKPLIEKELDKPKASGKSILLKTVSCGICHSDVHIHDGFFELGGDDKLPISLREPLTMGHEVYGEVVEIGEDVKNIKRGWVGVYFWKDSVHFHLFLEECILKTTNLGGGGLFEFHSNVGGWLLF